VPRTVIDDAFAFDGAPTEKAFAQKVLAASRMPARSSLGL
jgi:hypothetical protein